MRIWNLSQSTVRVGTTTITYLFYENDKFYRDMYTSILQLQDDKEVCVQEKKLESGGERVIEKDDEFNPPQEMMDEGNFEKLRRLSRFEKEGYGDKY